MPARRADHPRPNLMKWIVLLLLAGVAGAFLLRASPGLSAAAAGGYLQNGALLVDVRTIEEFNAKHATNAVNIPLAELAKVLPDRVSDRSRVLLLYCRSGRRSGTAEQRLRALGYTNAFNIGGYAQAEKIVSRTTR